MAEIIELHDYRLTKQREFFINLYRFLNNNMNQRFDELQIKLKEELKQLFESQSFDTLYIHYFNIPTITFIVTVFVKNSDLSCFFPKIIKIDNEENIQMFKNTLIKILETFVEGYMENPNKDTLEKGMDIIINHLYQDLLEMIPDEIVIV